MSEDVGWFIFFECDVNSERAHLSTTHTLSECCLSSHTTPGQMGTGQKCPMRSKTRPSLDICAPKPHLHSSEDGESAQFLMRTYWERSAPKIKAADGVGRFDLFANFTCSFCNSWSRKRSWRLSPACPTALCRFRLPRKTVCRLLWIWCFPCSLLLGDRPVFRLLPVEGSMPHAVRFYTSRRGGSFSSSLWGNYFPTPPYFQ